MPKRLLITQPNTNTLWILDESIPEITAFSPAPTGNVGGRAIWCDDTGRIICLNITSGGFNHYNPGTGSWTNVAGASGVWDMGGTSYTNVWACSGDSHVVQQFNGTLWTTDVNPLGSSRLVQIAVTGTGLDEVFVAAHNSVYFRTGGAIGSGVWVDRRAQLLTDTGIDISGSVPDCRGVWAVSKNEVYWLISGSEGGTQHWVIKWNGSNFSNVSTGSKVNNYGVSDTSFEGVSGSHIWWMQASPSYGEFRFVKFDGTNIIRQTASEHNMGFGCKLIAETSSKWWAAGFYTSPNRIGIWQGDGSQNGWSLLHTHNVATSVTGGAGMALWEPGDSDPPIIINEDPFPDERFVPIISNLTSFDVIDEYSGVVLNTLDAYIDGYWAFKNGGFQYPFTGPDSYFSEISPFDSYEGYAFIFDYEHLWEEDKQIDVRVIAEDQLGNTSDNIWSFYTPANIPPVLRNQDPAANETRVSINREIIEFDVVSPSYTEIFGDSVDAYVEGVLGFNDETFNAPFDGIDAYYGAVVTIEGYDGYKVKLDYTNTPWSSYQLINVRVIAQDAYGFWMDEEYTFRIEDTEGPIFINTYPSPGSSFIDQNTLIWIDFYDIGSGIDAYSINAYINNIHVYDGYNFIASYDGPLSDLTPKTFDSYDGYRLTIDKVNSFDSGETVHTEITVLDKEGN